MVITYRQYCKCIRWLDSVVVRVSDLSCKMRGRIGNLARGSPPPTPVNPHPCIKVICCITRVQQMAVEMVLTLGQAFEVAYQLAMLKNGSADAGNTDKSSSTTPTTNRVWRPPVNSVKPLRAAVVAGGSGTTVGLRWPWTFHRLHPSLLQWPYGCLKQWCMAFFIQRPLNIVTDPPHKSSRNALDWRM